MPIASMTKTAPDSALSPWEVRQKEEALALQEKTDAPEIVAAQKKRVGSPLLKTKNALNRIS